MSFPDHETVIVGGLASKASNVLPLTTIGNIVGAGDFKSIDGAHEEEGRLVASTPSFQADRLTEMIEASQSKRFVLISHSVGFLAALRTVEQFRDRVSVLALAPTLPRPLTAHHHPHIQAKIQLNGNEHFMPSYSFALGDRGPSQTLPTPTKVLIPSSYEEDVEAQSTSVMSRVQNAVSKDLLRVVAPIDDWNKGLAEATQSIPKTIHVAGGHSLQGTPEDINLRSIYIADCFDLQPIK